MFRYRQRQLCFALALIGISIGQAVAVETLRVGVGGNVAWNGTVFEGNVTIFPTEYIVTQQFTEVGNTPGNLIDLSKLNNVAPAVIIKTVVDVDPELIEDQLELVNQMLVDAVSPLSGIARLEPGTQGNLSLVFIEFEPGTDLGEATQQVSEALDPIRPEGAGGPGFDVASGDVTCIEEVKTFEQQISDSHAEQNRGIGEEWGDCESYFNWIGGDQKMYADCFQVVCKNRDTGEVTAYPGRKRGKSAVAESAWERAAKGLQDDDEAERLPEGTQNPAVLPVALSPVHIAEGENVAQRALEFKGGITAPAVKDVSAAVLGPILLELIQSGGAEEAFERKGDQPALGSFVVLDLGSPIGVNRIRFYPRNTIQNAPKFPFQNDFLRQFELWLHDGQNLVRDSYGNYSPRVDDYVPMLRNTANEEPVVDLEVRPARLARYVRLKAISSFPYEIDELEVYGQGFMANSTYLSPIYDLGAVATWGNISWIERVAPPGRREDTNIVVRTRTGNDPTTLVYKRRNVQRPTDPELSTSLANPGQPLGRDEYLGLKDAWTLGAIEEDLQNWSTWSAPYIGGEHPGGTPILSPGPRRYLQFLVEFTNRRIDATKIIEQLGIEYLVPPLADDLVAEIYPRDVKPFESVQFTFAVRALMHIAGVVGIDGFEIETPTRVLGIDRIQILDKDEAVVVEQELNADIVLDSEGNPVVQLTDGSVHPLPYTVVSGPGTPL